MGSFLTAPSSVILLEIQVDTSDRNNLIDNTANGNTRNGIYLIVSARNILNNNTANHNIAQGILLAFTDFNSLNNNTANENGRGIVLGLSFGTTLKGNTSNENDLSGIILNFSQDNTLENNEATNNGGFGFTDDSTEFGTGEIDNDYFNNICFSNAGGGSNPIGLCEPQTFNDPPSYLQLSFWHSFLLLQFELNHVLLTLQSQLPLQ